MDEISLTRLKELSAKVEDWVNRYDIEKTVYEDLYRKHERVHRLIEDNPTHFQSKEEHNEACCISGYINICLLARINEMNESDDH